MASNSWPGIVANAPAAPERHRIAAALFALVALACAPRPCRAAPEGWRELPSGLHARRLTAVPSPDLPVAAWLVRLDPARHALRVVAVAAPTPGSAARSAAARLAPLVAADARADAVVNASYFDEAGRPLGLLVAGGKRLQPPNRRGWAWAAVAGGGLLIRPADADVPEGVAEAVQAGPLLVVDGKPRLLSSPRVARRAFVGTDAEGRVVLGATDGPIALGALARLLAAREVEGGAALVQAMNLDGGSSAQLFVAGDDPPLKVAGVPVPVFLAAVPK